MVFIGVDPDLHTMPMVALDDAGGLIGIHIFRAKGAKGPEAVTDMAALVGRWREMPKCFMTSCEAVTAVEGQEIYRGAGQDADTKNPRDLINLAAAAGIAMGVVSVFYPPAAVYYPKPAEWKQQVPKHIHHGRICEKMGWGFTRAGTGKRTYCIPTLPISLTGNVQGRDWYHAMDAVGLALWAREKYMTEQNRKLRLSQLNRTDGGPKQ